MLGEVNCNVEKKMMKANEEEGDRDDNCGRRVAHWHGLGYDVMKHRASVTLNGTELLVKGRKVGPQRKILFVRI